MNQDEGVIPAGSTHSMFILGENTSDDCSQYDYEDGDYRGYGDDNYDR